MRPESYLARAVRNRRGTDRRRSKRTELDLLEDVAEALLTDSGDTEEQVEVGERRRATLDHARERHPQRFRTRPRAKHPQKHAWINNPVIQAA